MRNNPHALDFMKETVMSARKRAYTQHTLSERAKVVALYRQGLKSKQIASQMGLDDSMVRAWIRKYLAYGDAALQPYWRTANHQPEKQVASSRSERDDLFALAFIDYASSLEPVASITRRFGLDYHAFKYHVERYHPELVARRNRLRTSAVVVWENRTE